MPQIIEITQNNGLPVLLNLQKIAIVTSDSDGNARVTVSGCEDPFTVKIPYDILRDMTRAILTEVIPNTNQPMITQATQAVSIEAIPRDGQSILINTEEIAIAMIDSDRMKTRLYMIGCEDPFIINLRIEELRAQIGA